MGLAGHVSPPHWSNANRTKVQRLSIRLKDLECCKAARYLFDMLFDLAAVGEIKDYCRQLDSVDWFCSGNHWPEDRERTW